MTMMAIYGHSFGSKFRNLIAESEHRKYCSHTDIHTDTHTQSYAPYLVETSAQVVT